MVVAMGNRTVPQNAFLVIIILSQAARQRQHCVNGDRLEIGKWQNSTPHRFKTPKPIAKKIGMDDQVGEGTRYAKFGRDRFTGVFWRDVRFLELSFFFTYIQGGPKNRTIF